MSPTLRRARVLAALRELDVAGDIATSGLAVEVRRRERIDIASWCADHEAETPEHLTPIVVWRKSREPWRVSLTLDDFLDLLGEARA